MCYLSNMHSYPYIQPFVFLPSHHPLSYPLQGGKISTLEVGPCGRWLNHGDRILPFLSSLKILQRIFKFFEINWNDEMKEEKKAEGEQRWKLNQVKVQNGTAVLEKTQALSGLLNFCSLYCFFSGYNFITSSPQHLPNIPSFFSFLF